MPNPYVGYKVKKFGVKSDDSQKRREGLHKERISDICYRLSPKLGKCHEYVFCH